MGIHSNHIIMDPNLELTYGAFEYLLDEVDRLRNIYAVDECIDKIKKAREALDSAVMVPVLLHLMLRTPSTASFQNLLGCPSSNQSTSNSLSTVVDDPE